jgi:putative endonuclease
VQSWEIKEGKAKAMQIERYIKKLSRTDKDKLVIDPHLLEAFLLERALFRQETGL